MPSGIYRQANARKPVSHNEEALLVRDPARPQRAFEYSREGTRAIFRRESKAVFGSVGYPGTPFQERVWNQLLRIPYGQTRSYEDLARQIDSAGSQRAVGHANGLNRIAIVIPCHRVVNKDGKLGGYGGGLWRKQFLLDLEQGVRRLD